MSVIFKAKLKSAKSAVAEKNYDYAYDLCHDLLELDDSNYNVHILLGVSCQHLEKWDEGEAVYKKSMAMPKANILAWQGLCALYESWGNQSKYEGILRELRGKYMEEGNTEKAWNTEQRIIDLCEQSGDKRKLVLELYELTPSGSLNSLIESSSGLDIPNTYDILKRMLDIETDLDAKTIEKEINKRKTRLGAGPIEKVRRDVCREIWSESSAFDTLRQIIKYLSADDSQVSKKLDYEEMYFEMLLDRSEVVNGLSDRLKMLSMANAAASNLVLNGRCSKAFEYLIEIADCGNDDNNDKSLEMLIDKYLELFPDGPLAISASVWLQLEDGSNAYDIEFANKGYESAKDSPFANVQLVRVALECSLYQWVIDAGTRSQSVLDAFCTKYYIKLEKSRLLIDLMIADAYLATGTHNAASAERLYRSCLEMNPGNTRATVGLGVSLCELDQYDEGKNLLTLSIESNPGNYLALGGLGYICMKTGDLQSSVDYLTRAIAANPNWAKNHVRLGQAYWQMGGVYKEDRQYAYSSWIQAAKIDPEDSQTFSGLGKWYKECDNDNVRAEKCFYKSFTLDNANEEAGQYLAEYYLKEGRDDLCESLLIKAVESKHDQKWAWSMLGFLRLRLAKYEPAIIGFRNAISLERTDSLCWEGLGDAYIEIGRFNTAAKVAEKVLQLDPSRISGYWLCIRAYMAANELDEALHHANIVIDMLNSDDFDKDERARWINAFNVSRAQCLTLTAAVWYEQSIVGRAVDSCNDALVSLHAVIADSNDSEFKTSYFMWKLVYDACIWIIRSSAALVKQNDLCIDEDVNALEDYLSATEDSIQNAPNFLKQISDTIQSEFELLKSKNGDVVEDHLNKLFMLAEKASRRCILTATSTALASNSWVDLGVLYYELYSRKHSVILELTKVDEGGNATVSNSLLDAAAGCAQASIQLDSSSENGYCLQGVIACYAGEAALSQHAFIMQSKLAPSSAVPWANLGFLYLHNQDIELANKAFSRAQMADPEFIPGWVGQAIIAETLGYEECIELFEHCFLSPIASKAIGDFGYAKHVWKSIIEKHTKSITSDAKSKDRVINLIKDSEQAILPGRSQIRLSLGVYSVRRYIESTKDKDGAGNHLLGMLLEQNGEFEKAVEAYTYAYKYVSSNSWCGSTSTGLRKWIALTHLARAQCSAGMYSESVSSYESAAILLETEDGILNELSGMANTSMQIFYATLGHSLALFFSERLEESLGKFEETLGLLEDSPELRPGVAIMLAQVLWALGTDEHRALARQHLLEVMSEHTDFLPGLTALFSIGMLQNDSDLLSATYTELQKARDAGDDVDHDVAKLEAYFAILQGDAVGGRRALSKAVFRCPEDGQLRILLANFELMSDRQFQARASANAALSLFKQAVRENYMWSAKISSRSLLKTSTLDTVVSALVVTAKSLVGGARNESEIASARSAAKRSVMYNPSNNETWGCLAGVESA